MSPARRKSPATKPRKTPRGRALAKPRARPPEPPPRRAPTLALRELFWHNVMREMLTALSVHSMNRSEPESAKLFDGRLAVLTRGGARIEIGAVHPLFACGVPGSEAAKALSIDLECTVFQIQTPGGEVFTLPLHEIRGFHALTPELAEELQRAAGSPDGADPKEPFGFAAFRSIASNPMASGGSIDSGDAAI